jgi:hypothetical protein
MPRLPNAPSNAFRVEQTSSPRSGPSPARAGAMMAVVEPAWPRTCMPAPVSGTRSGNTTGRECRADADVRRRCRP